MPKATRDARARASEIISNVQHLIGQIQVYKSADHSDIRSGLRRTELALDEEAQRWSKVASKALEQQVSDYNRLSTDAAGLVKELRDQHPDNSPIRINSGKALYRSLRSEDMLMEPN